MDANKNMCYVNLMSVFNKIEKNGITNVEDLNKALWDELYLATQDYINFYALMSKTSKKKNKKGEYLAGNIEKVQYIISRSSMDLEDIQMHIGVHVISKLSFVLRAPAERRLNYVYSMVNNEVNTICRRLFPGEVLPFDVPIANDKNDDGITISEIIPDTTYDPVHIVDEETEEEVILRHLALISNNHPAEILVYLLAALGMKSSDIGTSIIENGIVESCSNAINGISEKYFIPVAKLQNYLRYDMITEKDLALDTHDKNKIINHIYHLKSRAKMRILGKR